MSVMKIILSVANVFSNGNPYVLLPFSSFTCLIMTYLSAIPSRPKYERYWLNRIRFCLNVCVLFFNLFALALALQGYQFLTWNIIYIAAVLFPSSGLIALPLAWYLFPTVVKKTQEDEEAEIERQLQMNREQRLLQSSSAAAAGERGNLNKFFLADDSLKSTEMVGVSGSSADSTRPLLEGLSIHYERQYIETAVGVKMFEERLLEEAAEALELADIRRISMKSLEDTFVLLRIAPDADSAYGIRSTARTNADIRSRLITMSIEETARLFYRGFWTQHLLSVPLLVEWEDEYAGRGKVVMPPQRRTTSVPMPLLPPPSLSSMNRTSSADSAGSGSSSAKPPLVPGKKPSTGGGANLRKVATHGWQGNDHVLLDLGGGASPAPSSRKVSQWQGDQPDKSFDLGSSGPAVIRTKDWHAGGGGGQQDFDLDLGTGPRPPPTKVAAHQWSSGGEDLDLGNSGVVKVKDWGSEAAEEDIDLGAVGLGWITPSRALLSPPSPVALYRGDSEVKQDREAPLAAAAAQRLENPRSLPGSRPGSRPGSEPGSRPRTPVRSRPTTPPKTRSSSPTRSRTVYMRTWACSHTSEADLSLRSLGYRLVEHVAEADICVLNTCTFDDPSQFAFLSIIKQGKVKGVPVIVAGCMTNKNRDLLGNWISEEILQERKRWQYN
jgi:hypothetical protein